MDDRVAGIAGHVQHFGFGMRLAHPQPGKLLALWRGVVRTALLVLLVPALVVDANGRGLHDRLTDTAVVRD